MLAKSASPSSGEKSVFGLTGLKHLKSHVNSILRIKTATVNYAGTAQEHAPPTQANLGSSWVVCPPSVLDLADQTFWLMSFFSSVSLRKAKITSFVAVGGHDHASLCPL